MVTITRRTYYYKVAFISISGYRHKCFRQLVSFILMLFGFLFKISQFHSANNKLHCITQYGNMYVLSEPDKMKLHFCFLPPVFRQNETDKE